MKTNRILTSGRIPVTPPAEVSDDRYQFLALNEAEPNLGTSANNSILTTTTSGQRVWTSNITTSSVTTGNILKTDGSPYFVQSNIYNGRITISDELDVADYVSLSGTTSVRWVLTAKDNINNRYKFSTIDCINDGTTAFFTEYAVLLSHSDFEVANYASDITTGNIDLLASGDSANVTITYQRTTLGSGTALGYVMQN